jgi:hypothetical protein
MYSLHDNRLSTIPILLVVLFCAVAPGAVSAQVIKGKIGSSRPWGSGWLDLPNPVDFATGDRLRLSVGGKATKILVRLLPQGGDPNKAIGVLGGVIIVPKSRIVEVTLPEDRKQVVQISVHGGPSPWGTNPLGAGNGPATIISAERVRP